MDRWNEESRHQLEKDYLAFEEPWRQSGFSGPEIRWDRCCRPVAELIRKSGTFLDIGCANGYLLECLVKWKQEDGIDITPHGLDIGESLIGLARQRLNRYQDNLHVGDALTWIPPMRFDYVRTELVYVPKKMRERYIERLSSEYLAADGRLLVCEYRSSSSGDEGPWIDDILRSFGYAIAGIASAFDQGKQLTRVAELTAGKV